MTSRSDISNPGFDYNRILKITSVVTTGNTTKIGVDIKSEILMNKSITFAKGYIIDQHVHTKCIFNNLTPVSHYKKRICSYYYPGKML